VATKAIRLDQANFSIKQRLITLDSCFCKTIKAKHAPPNRTSKMLMVLSNKKPKDFRHNYAQPPWGTNACKNLYKLVTASWEIGAVIIPKIKVATKAIRLDQANFSIKQWLITLDLCFYKTIKAKHAPPNRTSKMLMVLSNKKSQKFRHNYAQPPWWTNACKN